MSRSPIDRQPHAKPACIANCTATYRRLIDDHICGGKVDAIVADSQRLQVGRTQNQSRCVASQSQGLWDRRERTAHEGKLALPRKIYPQCSDMLSKQRSPRSKDSLIKVCTLFPLFYTEKNPADGTKPHNRAKMTKKIKMCACVIICRVCHNMYRYTFKRESNPNTICVVYNIFTKTPRFISKLPN